MGDLVSNYRFVVKPVIKETGRSLDLARPMKIHPLTYQELPPTQNILTTPMVDLRLKNYLMLQQMKCIGKLDEK